VGVFLLLQLGLDLLKLPVDLGVLVVGRLQGLFVLVFRSQPGLDGIGAFFVVILHLLVVVRFEGGNFRGELFVGGQLLGQFVPFDLQSRAEFRQSGFVIGRLRQAVGLDVLNHGIQDRVGQIGIGFAHFRITVPDFRLEGLHLRVALERGGFLGIPLFDGGVQLRPEFPAIIVVHVRHDAGDNGGHHEKNQGEVNCRGFISRHVVAPDSKSKVNHSPRGGDEDLFKCGRKREVC
jgi:hypothetical protein